MSDEAQNKPTLIGLLKQLAANSAVRETGKAFLVALITAAFTYFGCRPLPQVIRESDEPDIRHVGAQGWVREPEEVARVVAANKVKSFAATPAGAVSEADLPAHVYLWEAHRKATGHDPENKNQGGVGSCVSFGTNTAIERTMVAEIAAGGPFQFKRIAEEVTYGGSRVEIGKGRIRGDGSVGAWAAKFVQQYGVVSREPHGKYDLTEYDEARCRSWGRAGVPNDLEPIAREHPVKEIAPVANWSEAKHALASGYGIAVCSDQGFSMRRDSRGVAAPRGSWAHCMALDGYHVDADGREYGHIENSWGPTAHTGPTGWGNPPSSGFWAEAKVIDGMLRQGDSWAFSAVAGFPARRIDWTVQATPRRRGPLNRLELPFALAP